MEFETAEMSIENCVELNNLFLNDIDLDELGLPEVNLELSSFDLMMVDKEVIANLKQVKDYSKDMMNLLTPVETIEQKSAVVATKLDKTITEIQRNTVADISAPLNEMFEEFSCFVSKAIVE
ncbi:MAG: hypothetical protein R3Y28_00850 [Candidatus Gastranaerophilales bacterium]